MKNTILWICLLGVSISTLIAQDKVTVKATLRNGDVVTGKTSLSKISLKTIYGKLEIPAQNLKQIRFGILKNESIVSKINKALDILSMGDEDAKIKAYAEVEAYSIDALPIVQDYVSNMPIDTSMVESPTQEYYDETATSTGGLSPQGLLDNLYAIYGVDGLSNEDVASTNEGYEMGGSMDIKNLKITTNYGNLDLPRNQITSLEVLEVEVSPEKSTDGSKVFNLTASKNISSNINGGWFPTGIYVKSGDFLQITASGSITLASLSNQIYFPNGNKSLAKTTDTNYDYNYNNTAVQYGMLVYKIGKNGTAQKAGANFTGRIYGSGELYLSIYETVYNPANKGGYTVKVAKK
jgi:hypothetical protein